MICKAGDNGTTRRQNQPQFKCAHQLKRLKTKLFVISLNAPPPPPPS